MSISKQSNDPLQIRAEEIRDQWDAASILMIGIVQRLEGPPSEMVSLALKQVAPGSLVQVELMIILSALQDVSRSGVALTHDTALEAVRLHDPGKSVAFACSTFEHLWKDRGQQPVNDEFFAAAIAFLSETRVAMAIESRAGQRAPTKKPWWKIFKR